MRACLLAVNFARSGKFFCLGRCPFGFSVKSFLIGIKNKIQVFFLSMLIAISNLKPLAGRKAVIVNKM
jgi:hypothetical protein